MCFVPLIATVNLRATADIASFISLCYFSFYQNLFVNFERCNSENQVKRDLTINMDKLLDNLHLVKK